MPATAKAQSRSKAQASSTSPPRGVKRQISSVDSGDEREPATPKKKRHPKQVSCNRCRDRKCHCDQGRPQCGSCQTVNVDCEYPGPEPSSMASSLSLTEIILGTRDVVRIMDSILKVSTVSFDENQLPISLMYPVDADRAGFIGRTALSAYTLLSHEDRKQVPLSYNTPGVSGLGVDCTFVSDAPSTPMATERPPNLDYTFLTDCYVRYGTHEFRFADLDDIKCAASAADPSGSPRVLFACALGLWHCPSARNAQAHERDLQRANDIFAMAVEKYAEHRDDCASIERVETRLLYLQCLFIARTDVELAWQLSEDCMVDVKRLGLHRDPLYLAIPEADRARRASRRRWAFHNSLLVNRWYSLLTGRPPALRKRDFDTLLPVDGQQPRWAFHSHLFEFNVDVLGPILDECTSVHVPPLVTISKHDEALSNWYSKTSARFKDLSLEGVALRLLALHVRVMLFAPYTTPYARISQYGVTQDVEKEQREADKCLGEAAQKLLDIATRQLGHLHNTNKLLAARLAWAPHHIMAAGGLLAVECTLESDFRAGVQRAIDGVGYLRSLRTPTADRTWTLLTRLKAEADKRLALSALQIPHEDMEPYINVPVEPGASLANSRASSS